MDKHAEGNSNKRPGLVRNRMINHEHQKDAKWAAAEEKMDHSFDCPSFNHRDKSEQDDNVDTEDAEAASRSIHLPQESSLPDSGSETRVSSESPNKSKKRKGKLKEVDAEDLSAPPMDADEETKKEYFRKRNAMYSRRKYMRKKIEIEVLQQQKADLQRENTSLREEGARLAGLVDSANRIVSSVHVGTSQSVGPSGNTIVRSNIGGAMYSNLRSLQGLSRQTLAGINPSLGASLQHVPQDPLDLMQLHLMPQNQITGPSIQEQLVFQQRLLEQEAARRNLMPSGRGLYPFPREHSNLSLLQEEIRQQQLLQDRSTSDLLEVLNQRASNETPFLGQRYSSLGMGSGTVSGQQRFEPPGILNPTSAFLRQGTGTGLPQYLVDQSFQSTSPFANSMMTNLAGIGNTSGISSLNPSSFQGFNGDLASIVRQQEQQDQMYLLMASQQRGAAPVSSAEINRPVSSSTETELGNTFVSNAGAVQRRGNDGGSSDLSAVHSSPK